MLNKMTMKEPYLPSQNSPSIVCAIVPCNLFYGDVSSESVPFQSCQRADVINQTSSEFESSSYLPFVEDRNSYGPQ